MLLLLVLVSALRNGVGGGGGCGGIDGVGAGVGAGAECGLRVVEDYDQKNLLMFFLSSFIKNGVLLKDAKQKKV